MNHLATLLVGPLAGTECRRAVSRGWLIVVRVLAGSAVVGVAALCLWWWWISARTDPNHQPYLELRIGLGVVEGMLVTIALVLAPAVLAGSLAGDRERGSLALLLTTRVSAREIVTGRLAGKLAQVGTILLAGVPAVVLLATLAGLEPGTMLVLLLLPVGVGIGGGGLAACASVLSRRGRDALLAVYLADLFLLLSPLSATLGLSTTGAGWLSALNPYVGLEPLVHREAVGLALTTIGLWLALGLAGAGVASWRLRASSLAPIDGDRVGRGLGRGRRGFVPAVDEARPMLWKELFIERVGTLGGFGRWAGLVLVLGLVLGSGGLTLVYAWNVRGRGDPVWAEWALDMLHGTIGRSGGLLSSLIQCAIGLRAAVSISSERERGTWDALLTSPLHGREIVRAKLSGSMNALRWLILATVLAWALAATTGAVPVGDSIRWASEVVFVGAFMAAVGVRTSLSCRTATRAMALTIGTWLGASAAILCASAVLLGAGLLLCNFALILASQSGLIAPVTTLWFPLRGVVAWPLANQSLFFVATLLIVADTRLRFDRLAGRMTEGGVSVAFEEFVYGRPEAPALIGADGEELPWDGEPATASRGDGGPHSGTPPTADQRREDAVAGSA